MDNVRRALDHLVAPTLPAKSATTTKLLGCWQFVLGLDIPVGRIVIGKGIRDFLRSLFRICAAADQTLWLPGDVYPVYWQLASENRTVLFSTLPSLDWSILDRTSGRDCVLLPTPLSPAGRRLTNTECCNLLSWLHEGSDRQLILDCAYNYEFSIADGSVSVLVAHERYCSIFRHPKHGCCRIPLGLPSCRNHQETKS